MAISAISSISAGGFVRLLRTPLVGAIEPLGKGGPIPRVAPIPSLAARNKDRDSTAPDEAATQPATAGPQLSPKPPTLDPRRAASLLAPLPGEMAGPAAASAEDPIRRRREIQDRLDELMGQKGSIERRQAQQKSESSAEIVNELAQLKSRDSEVRAHEAAHMAAGGRFITGGASYTYERGPDGGEYAIGGEVGIDTSPVPGNPEATAEKMRIVRAAALAPSDPSSADLAVAASAAEAEAAAMAEIAQARIDASAGAEKTAGATGAAATAGRGDASAPRKPLNVLA